MKETNYSNITPDYGTECTPANKYYPSILAKEKEQKVNGTEGTELGCKRTNRVNKSNNKSQQAH